MTLKKRIKRGFTLVEILIVVVILGILAAIVIPQFSNASEEASYNRVRADLQTVRSQIQLYKIQHLGTLPSVDYFDDHMTGYTLATTGPAGECVTATTEGALGPYLQQIPSNPFVDAAVAKVVGAVGATDAGWTYDPATGAFHAVQGVASEDITQW